MLVRKARKLLPHRFQDVMACLRWYRWQRLHIASVLLTEICTVIECGSRDKVERALMISLKSALVSKNVVELREVFAAWQENRK